MYKDHGVYHVSLPEGLAVRPFINSRVYMCLDGMTAIVHVS